MMTIENIIGKVVELKDLERMAKDLDEMISEIKSVLKSEMDERGAEELVVGSHTIRYTTVVSNRFDTSAFKLASPDAYKAFIRPNISKRFTVA